MRNRYMLIGVVGIVVGVLLSSAVFVLAGNLDSPGVPGATNSYTLDDIYNRLDTGAAGTQSTFTEPGTAPGTGTMHTLNEIYDLIGLRAPVPKTGDAYNDGCCTGEDGELQKGVAWPNPRFTKHGDGTVTDNLTGLMWMQDANAGNDCQGGDTGTEYWLNALASAAACNAGAGFAGYTDWRLPNVREIQSLAHYGFSSYPAVPNTAGTGQWAAGDPFDNVQSAKYWSSTTHAGGTSDAWFVDLDDGYVNDNGKSYSYYVWPVRGGH
jgi:hypothetical protein